MKQKMKRLLQSMTKKTNRLFLASLAVVLALTIGFLAHFQMFGMLVKAEDLPKEYVEQLRLYRGKTKEGAMGACLDDGFIPVDGNLNEGTGYDAVVLGYTTTEDKEAAVTDVRMMQMTSGFSTLNYSEVVARKYPGLDSMIDEEYTTIREFRDKYNSGSYNAKTALKYLNIFEIPELKTKLGDYYLSDSLDKAMLKKLFLQTSGVVSTTSINLLALGVSDCSDDNWASRVYQNKDILDVGGDDDSEAGKDPYAELDRKYLSHAEKFVTSIQDFSTKYQNGRSREAANGGELPKLDSEAATDEEINAHGAEPLCIVTHELLNKYKFDDDMLLGDWLVEMGNKTLSNKAELRELYPLIASMTFGQVITTQMTGFNNCVFYLKELSDADNKLNDNLNEAKQLCLDYDKTETISVWAGIDQKLFDAECAVTGDAQRYTNLKETADNLVKRNSAIETLESLSEIFSKLTSLGGGAIVLLELPTMAISYLSYLELISISWCWNHGTMFMLFAFMGKAAAFLGYISGILMLAIIVIMVIVFLYEVFKPECDDLTYTSIPKMAIDMNFDENSAPKGGMLRYDLIQTGNGKGDINAYEGKQWNALYSSQNPDAGEPIEVVGGESPFIVQKNNAKNPAGYKAVRNFDELYAANLNANVREEDAPAMFMFYYAPGESAGTTEVKEEDKPKEEAQGETQQETTTPAETQPAPAEKKQYIASLYLSCEESETLAKNKLTQQGYNVVDVDLTPSYWLRNKIGAQTKRSYTYLGYTVTTSEKAAVTDIRIAKFKSTSQAASYGTVAYTAAGFDAHGNSICYTKDPAVGSPILADDIQVADKISDKKQGYEPVSYFGGVPYNFDACENDNVWNKAKYIFFSPSEKFTSGTEYISGIYFVSGTNIVRSGDIPGFSLSEYAEQLGGKLFGDDDFTKGRVWKKWDSGSQSTFKVSDLRTYLGYTTTYNPKRAIYDVQFYAGTPKMQSFAPVISAYTGNSDSTYAATGYGITSVFMQGAKKMVSNQTDTQGYRSKAYHYEVNNYDDFTLSSGEALATYDKLVDNVIPGVSWEAVASQPRVLYACGYKKGYEPLTKDDLVLSNSSEVPKGFASVQDVKFPYEEKPLNLAYYFSEKSDECTPIYMYLHRAAPVKGKYIASVRVATYNPDQSWSKEEREANNTFSNDLCYISLLGSSSEILNQSLALYSTDAWYNTTDKSCTDAKNWDSTIGSANYNTKAAFMGVTYTNNPAKAIHGLLRYRAKDGATPPETLTVNGAKYSLVQNVSSKTPVPITSPNLRQYYLYATTSSGGSSTGDALTELTISDKVFEPGLSTVLTVDHGDIPAQKDFYGKTISEAQYVIPFGDTNESLYIHQKTNTDLSGIDSFFVGVGDTDTEAMRDLLTQGATNCVPLNLNKGAATDASVFIGYHYYNPDYVNTKRTKYYMESAVKDLYVYVGENPEKRLTIDKRKYTLCGNRNLNYGTGGTPMYLYQTTALINSKDKNDASYITSIAAAQYDRVPADIAENRWENLLTTENKRINMNEGLNAGVRGYDRSDNEQHLVDSRVFVFVHRNDNYVKPEAVITGGYFTETTTFGDVVLSKK